MTDIVSIKTGLQVTEEAPETLHKWILDYLEDARKANWPKSYRDGLRQLEDRYNRSCEQYGVMPQGLPLTPWAMKDWADYISAQPMRPPRYVMELCCRPDCGHVVWNDNPYRCAAGHAQLKEVK